MNEKIINYLQEAPDEVLAHLQFSLPWQYDPDEGKYVDPDGFPPKLSSKEDVLINREELQKECWNRFNRNPHINTSIRGTAGRLTGMGFGASSDVKKIQDVIEEISEDPRNRLYNFWPKYVSRAFIEGELFLCFTVHEDSFIEVDFYDPSSISSQTVDDGIIYHPRKTIMPLVYCVELDDNGEEEQIPSVYVSYFPELIKEAAKNDGFKADYMKSCKSSAPAFKSLGGFYRFMVSWDRGFVTHRNVSYLRSVIEWLNHYENLKKYEIDHKKSSGAYVWVIEMEDIKAFKAWLALSDSDRRKTGIMSKKTPGSTLILPPGMKLEARNPKLPSISDEDTDILHMITSGLNEPEDVTTGSYRKSTFASIKTSRGPMSDRMSDEIAYFERFLRFDFWKPIFHLKSQVARFPKTFTVKEAVDFDDKGEPKFEKVKKKPEHLIDIAFPTSEMLDPESPARAYLGVKHGSVIDTLGIPPSELARRLGFQDYKRLRLKHATEKEAYPELISTMDMEGVQERAEAEPAQKPKLKRPKGEKK